MTKFQWLIIAITTLISGWLGYSLTDAMFGQTGGNTTSTSIALFCVFATVGFLASYILYLDQTDQGA